MSSTELKVSSPEYPSSSSAYVCTLDEKSLKKAKEELQEDTLQRLSSVETLRKWVLQQPHIHCPTDTWFLLLFLRVRYYSQLDARKLLENFLSRRTKFPRWFHNLDPCDPKILAAIDDGFLLVLPERDEEGRKILIFRPAFVDLNSCGGAYTRDDVFRACSCVIDYLYLVDEMTSVNGTVVISDMGDVTLKHVTQVNNDERKDFLQTWQGSYPARVKHMHVYNVGMIADILLQLFKFCMSEKLQSRLKIHGQLLENLYKEVPMHLLPIEYLPDDYTGHNAGTRKEIIEKMKAEITEPSVRARIQYLSSAQFRIDETLAPPRESFLQESFRKLNLD